MPEELPFSTNSVKTDGSILKKPQYTVWGFLFCRLVNWSFTMYLNLEFLHLLTTVFFQITKEYSDAVIF